jgi:hypothetical protein
LPDSNISIHHMYRFKLPLALRYDGAKIFQYITCIGSRYIKNKGSDKKCYFNTSHVSVQVGTAVLTGLALIISIHHMYRFKIIAMLIYFFISHFNTSHVSVQVSRKRNISKSLDHFNTSHVSVQVKVSLKIPNLTLISIHHMYRFKVKVSLKIPNLTLISIHHMYRFKAIDKKRINNIIIFQYITCIGSSYIASEEQTVEVSFQYITCIGSSWVFLYRLCCNLISIHHMYRFKLDLLVLYI